MKSSKTLLDLRIRRTYKFLWDALMALMSEKDFESIAVTEICERAMVHRTTFYKHYEDKNGLLFHGMQDELNALLEAFDTLETDREPSITAHMLRVFEHVLGHERFYRLMLCGDGFGNFTRLFTKSLAERLKHRFQMDDLAMPASLHAQILAAAIVSTVAWWLENACPYSPSEMADYLAVHLKLLPSHHQ